jgi:dipeptidase E
MKRIFLGGGGGEKDTVELDKRFVSLLDLEKPLIYVPVAQDSDKYPACFEWFASTFSPLCVTKIEMLDDLHAKINPSQIAGVYIGGGDTVKLWTEMKNGGFDAVLKRCIELGIPVYGGSAGAIVLGKDIRSAPEGNKQTAEDAQVMDMIYRHAICCHVENLADVQFVEKSLGLPIIGLSERSGAYLQDQVLEVVGFEPLWILKSDTCRALYPGETLLL